MSFSFKCFPLLIILEAGGGGVGKIECKRRKYCGQKRMGTELGFISLNYSHNIVVLGCAILFSLPL